MHEPACPDPTSVFGRDSRDPSIIVADGYGLSIHVKRGHLIVADGIGATRRERKLSRIERTVRRLVIIGHSGAITLEALRWCHHVGISVICIQQDGTLLLAEGMTGTDDPRLRRAQALAREQELGLAITRQLLTEKLHGQAGVLTRLGEDHAADRALALRDDLATADSLDRFRQIEAQAANVYFAAWTRQVTVPFAGREQQHVPAHWRTHEGRRSVLDYGRSPRKAAAPLNATLNYVYALAEAECRLALLAVGLDPGLGLMHTDAKNRDALALDLMEPLRPKADDVLLTLLTRRHFTRRDFRESADGTCRILPPLTHELAELTRPLRREAARLAEDTAHTLAKSGVQSIPLTTPLTGRNHSSGTAAGGRRPRREAATPKRPARTCRDCGAELPNTAKQLCASCWPVTRAKLAREQVESINAARIGAERVESQNTRALRSQSLRSHRALQAAWKDESSGSDLDFDIQIAPYLAIVTPAAIRAATGLSPSAASRIRSGKLRPHRRHWPAMLALVKSDATTGNTD